MDDAIITVAESQTESQHQNSQKASAMLDV